LLSLDSFWHQLARECRGRRAIARAPHKNPPSPMRASSVRYESSSVAGVFISTAVSRTRPLLVRLRRGVHTPGRFTTAATSSVSGSSPGCSAGAPARCRSCGRNRRGRDPRVHPGRLVVRSERRQRALSQPPAQRFAGFADASSHSRDESSWPSSSQPMSFKVVLVLALLGGGKDVWPQPRAAFARTSALSVARCVLPRPLLA
jgi:hypothetical protein